MLTFFVNTTIILTHLFLVHCVSKMKESNKNKALWAGRDVVSKGIPLATGFVEFDLYTHDGG